MRVGVWSIVNGSEQEPNREGDENRYSKFVLRRDEALATIVLSVHPSLLYLLGNPHDPAVVWTILNDQFQRKTWANTLVLRRLPSLEVERRKISKGTHQGNNRDLQRIGSDW